MELKVLFPLAPEKHVTVIPMMSGDGTTIGNMDIKYGDEGMLRLLYFKL